MKSQGNIRGKRPNRINAIAVAKMMAEMTGGAATMPRLKEVSGLAHNTILGYLRAMRAEGVCHIAKWERDSKGRMTLAAHAIGRFPDAPKNLVPRREIEARRRIKVAIKEAPSKYEGSVLYKRLKDLRARMEASFQ